MKKIKIDSNKWSKISLLRDYALDWEKYKNSIDFSSYCFLISNRDMDYIELVSIYELAKIARYDDFHWVIALDIPDLSGWKNFKNELPIDGKVIMVGEKGTYDYIEDMELNAIQHNNSSWEFMMQSGIAPFDYIIEEKLAESKLYWKYLPVLPNKQEILNNYLSKESDRRSYYTT